MAEPEDMIVPMLREIGGEIRSLNTQVDELRTHIDERFDEVAKTQKTFKQALSADSLMTRLLTGEFEERIEVSRSLASVSKRLRSKFVHSRVARD